ncbi:MAG: peptide chain release factor N(5)-glutamine methyltransferase [Spirochaetes bacterium]|nr:peptide chain release factor N(5)-glutamine methyltransferase [Spirochaetota bacterium]
MSDTIINNTIIHAIGNATKLLEDISATPRLDAEILMAHALGIERHKLFLFYKTIPKKSVITKFQRLLSRRLKSEPIAYIVGYKEFYSLPFKVNRHVLIPRPETELVVDCAIYYAPQHAHILDIGTGSGAIAIAIKYNRPDCLVWATDISANALSIAKKNATTILGKNKITFLQSNLFDSLPPMTFEIIVSNPPYINHETYTLLQKDIHYEPQEALVAPDNGFGIIRLILENAGNYLSDNGCVILEIGENLVTQIHECALRFNYSLSILNDYAGLPRIAIVKKISTSAKL